MKESMITDQEFEFTNDNVSSQNFFDKTPLKRSRADTQMTGETKANSNQDEEIKSVDRTPQCCQKQVDYKVYQIPLLKQLNRRNSSH
jgi:hypothetical protein